jgi:hypothetical protein
MKIEEKDLIIYPRIMITNYVEEIIQKFPVKNS